VESTFEDGRPLENIWRGRPDCIVCPQAVQERDRAKPSFFTGFRRLRVVAHALSLCARTAEPSLSPLRLRQFLGLLDEKGFEPGEDQLGDALPPLDAHGVGTEIL